VTLDEQILKGDILLVKGHTPVVGAIIRTVTHSDYTHAACYVGAGHIIESNWSGVKMRAIYDYRNKAYDIHRHLTATPEEVDTAVEWMKTQTGKKYDYGGLVGILWAMFGKGRDNPFDDKDEYWCSELIADGFLRAEVPMDCDEQTYKYSPADIGRSKFFQVIKRYKPEKKHFFSP
jgi:uncharacterized protein YycO